MRGCSRRLQHRQELPRAIWVVKSQPHGSGPGFLNRRAGAFFFPLAGLASGPDTAIPPDLGTGLFTTPSSSVPSFPSMPQPDKSIEVLRSLVDAVGAVVRGRVAPVGDEKWLAMVMELEASLVFLRENE